MRPFFILFILLFSSCTEKGLDTHNYTSVDIQIIYEDSVSIRAIEMMPGSLAFAGSKGIFGSVDVQTDQIRANIQEYDSILPEFRSVAHTTNDFFMLSIGSPALLFKTGDGGKMELVYTETDSLAFYDSMRFWNDLEGLAIGDSMDGCMSIIITRDGGASWNKLNCSEIPAAETGEGAFAASNTNIAVVGDKAWLATTAGRIFHTPDKGKTWEVVQTPIVHGTPTQGIYSVDFNDASLGIAIGGDYTNPMNRDSNKALTKDGGNTWQLLADGQEPGYKSSVQFVPNSGGKDIVAVGFTGISYSKDQGATWTGLSEESFYTLRFLNDSVAYAAGKNRIAKLLFK